MARAMKGVNVKEMPTIAGIEKKEDFDALAKVQIPEAELLAKNGTSVGSQCVRPHAPQGLVRARSGRLGAQPATNAVE